MTNYPSPLQFSRLLIHCWRGGAAGVSRFLSYPDGLSELPYPEPEPRPFPFDAPWRKGTGAQPLTETCFGVAPWDDEDHESFGSGCTDCPHAVDVGLDESRILGK
jgi:hypothetical protein